MKNSGVTLIELLVVVSIVSILIIALGFSYEGWMGNYRIESITKELYFDLMDARSRAMSHNRMHWAVLEDQQYRIVDDTHPLRPDGKPGGNGIRDAQDLQVLPQQTPPLPPPPPKRYEYNYQLSAVGQGMPQVIAFNTRGLISWTPAVPDMTFRFISTRDPDYDCIMIEQSKMWMGKFDTANNVCERR
jgi:prepilin-type N-terminal cleavage/methylation domain-containing protein